MGGWVGGLPGCTGECEPLVRKEEEGEEEGEEEEEGEGFGEEDFFR